MEKEKEYGVVDYTDYGIKIFIIESNAIENERSPGALETSLNAWNHIKDSNFLTIEDLLTCHLLIMGNINPGIAGKFRDYKVEIDDKPKGYPPHAIEHAVRNWLTVANAVKTIDAIKENHIWFEIIHPFGDGNGRIGRMVLLWQSKKSKLPFAVIKADTKHEKYYPWFTEARMVGKHKYKGD